MCLKINVLTIKNELGPVGKRRMKFIDGCLKIYRNYDVIVFKSIFNFNFIFMSAVCICMCTRVLTHMHEDVRGD